MKEPTWEELKKKLEDAESRIRYYADDLRQLQFSYDTLKTELIKERSKILSIKATMENNYGVNGMEEIHVNLRLSPQLFFMSKDEDRKEYIKHALENMFHTMNKNLLKVPW